MSRLISTETPATTRTRLLKLTFYAARELRKQKEINNESKDMAAFIVLTLAKISRIVNQTTKAWEARNFWIKSDLFQKEWAWVSARKEELEQALKENDWSSIESISALIVMNTSLSTIGLGISNSKPWEGAWVELNSRQKKRCR